MAALAVLALCGLVRQAQAAECADLGGRYERRFVPSGPCDAASSGACPPKTERIEIHQDGCASLRIRFSWADSDELRVFDDRWHPAHPPQDVAHACQRIEGTEAEVTAIADAAAEAARVRDAFAGARLVHVCEFRPKITDALKTLGIGTIEQTLTLEGDTLLFTRHANYAAGREQPTFKARFTRVPMPAPAASAAAATDRRGGAP